MNLLLRVAVGIPLVAGICSAEGGKTDFTLTPTGFFSWEFGQVMKGRNKNIDTISHTAMNDIYSGFGYNISFSPKTEADLSLVLKTYTEFPNLAQWTTRKQYFFIFTNQASVKHALYDNENLRIGLTFGYFPFKYNKDVRNLGEYLFRTGTYPQYILNYWDYPETRLSGLNINGKLWNCINVNLLAYLNTDWIAVKDLNLGFIASYECANFLEIGVGGTLNSVVSANENLTTPLESESQYIKDGLVYNYTFRGSKIMTRLSIDTKRLFSFNLFGKEDLKFYSEAALLGVRNYPLAPDSILEYNNPFERIPVMFGLNVPAFKILDVLSVEAEWFGGRYPNDIEQIVKLNLPIPYFYGTSNDKLQPYVKDDNWKWSIYGTKTISHHFSFTFQVASDHLRTFALAAQETEDWQEICRKPNHWYYVTKFGVSF